MSIRFGKIVTLLLLECLADESILTSGNEQLFAFVSDNILSYKVVTRIVGEPTLYNTVSIVSARSI